MHDDRPTPDPADDATRRHHSTTGCSVRDLTAGAARLGIRLWRGTDHEWASQLPAPPPDESRGDTGEQL